MLIRALRAVVLYAITLAACWFGGRKQGQTDAKAHQNVIRLEAAREAREVENEVEAVDRDALKRRAAIWVRKPER